MIPSTLTLTSTPNPYNKIHFTFPFLPVLRWKFIHSKNTMQHSITLFAFFYCRWFFCSFLFVRFVLFLSLLIGVVWLFRLFRFCIKTNSIRSLHTFTSILMNLPCESIYLPKKRNTFGQSSECAYGNVARHRSIFRSNHSRSTGLLFNSKNDRFWKERGKEKNMNKKK